MIGSAKLGRRFGPVDLEKALRHRPVTDPDHVQVLGMTPMGDYFVIAPRPNQAARAKDYIANKCHKYFPIIQEKCPEMADYELVEPMAAGCFNLWSIFCHLNFKAKPKNGDDSSVEVFFAEIDMFKKDVMCIKLDINATAGTDSYPHCKFCHPCPSDGPVCEGYVYAYHPPDTSTWKGAC
ncbi:hypothetical protein RND81_03G207100 [Saponaria officinalis]|uniref:DUF3615 domain-containing protein n=2 Tax=Saponaria officinalis TaxID=3572 RepID=A0AAW1MA14_SAPOF